MTIRTAILTLGGALLLAGTAIAQANNPTIAPCDGLQYLCVSAEDTQFVEVCVNIIVDPDNPNTDSIAFFQISWGDGSPNTILPGSANPAAQIHLYDLADFLASCDYETQTIIKLETYYTSSNGGVNFEPSNSAFILTFRQPPQANFGISANPCTGIPMTFQGSITGVPSGGGATCPSEGLTFEGWELNAGSGVYYQGNVFQYNFDSAGIYNIRYCAGNVCDTVCQDQQLTIYAPPTAVVQPDPQLVSVSENYYKLCKYGPFVYASFDASASLNLEAYQWTVTGPSGGWQWHPNSQISDSSTVVIKFKKPGIYIVKLKVSNICDQTDLLIDTVEVLELPELQLDPQMDTCFTLEYSPAPLDTNVVYTINGQVQSNFPVSLPIAPNPYVVKATLSHFCGEQLLLDTFSIAPIPPVEILSPDSNLQVCIGSASIPLLATPGGYWTGGGSSLSAQVTGTFFIPNQPGSFQLIANAGFGVCRNYDTLLIDVEEPYALSLDAPTISCFSLDYTPAPFDSVVQYAINGVLQDSFPVILPAGDLPYLVSAAYSNVCGSWVVSKKINVILPKDVEILPPQDSAFCSGTSPVQLFASDTLGTWQGPHVTPTAGGGAMFEPAEPGTYVIVFERGTGVCYSNDSLQLTVVPADSVDAGEDLFLCSSQLFHTFNHPVPNGAFSGFALSGDTIDLSQLVPDSAYLYIYTDASLPQACNADQRTVTVAAPPLLEYTADRDTACQDEVITLSATASDAVEIIAQWGDGSLDTNLLSHSYDVPGTYAVTFTAYTLNPNTGEPLCKVLDSLSLYIPEPIPPGGVSFTALPDTGCAALTVAFLNTSTGQDEVYRWDFDNGQQYTGFAPPPVTYFEDSQHDTTTYIIRLSVPNGCGSYEAVDSVAVLPRPRADFALSNASPCSGASFETQVLSLGYPTSNVFYTATGLEIPASPGEPVSFQFFTDNANDTIGIWLVSANDCGKDTAFQQVVITPPSVVALIGLPDTTTICQGATVSFLNYSTPGADIAWTVSGGNVYVGDTIMVTFDEPGTYHLTLHAYECGYDSVSVPVTVYPLPQLDVQHDTEKCLGEPVNFQVSTTGAGVQLWYGDGVFSFNQTSSYIYQEAGSYTPYAAAVSDRGCKVSWQGNLQVFQLPDAQILTADTICSGDAVQFSGISNIPGAVCSWQFGDGQLAAGCSVAHTYTEPGFYSAFLSVVSGPGCVGADTVPVFVRSSAEAGIQFQILEPCPPAVVNFLSTSTGATDLHWLTGDGATTGNTAFQHIYTQGGDYEIELVATSNGLCPDTARASLSVPFPVNFDMSLVPHCTVEEGGDLTVITDPENSITVSAENYLSTGPYHPALPAGTYTVEVEDANGCYKDTSFFVLANEELFLEVSQDSFFLFLGEFAQLQANVNLSDATILWEPPTYLSDPAIADPVSTPTDPIVYYVYATDRMGCQKVDTVWVSVELDREKEIFIPNAFTPNQDGVNDIFYVRSVNRSVKGIDDFRIFDKYNEKMFDLADLPGAEQAVPENPYYGWDGNFKGSKAEAGPYRFTVAVRYLNGEMRQFTGTVHLIR